MDVPDDPDDGEQYSYCEPDEGELPDYFEKHEVTEDINYRETVQSLRSFMGCNHIPVLKRISFNRTRATIPGRMKCLKVLPMFQSQCHQMTKTGEVKHNSGRGLPFQVSGLGWFEERSVHQDAKILIQLVSDIHY